MKLKPATSNIKNPFKELVKLKRIEIDIDLNEKPVEEPVKYLKKKPLLFNQSNELF